MATWDEGAPGVLVLPSGRRIRGRSLRRAVSAELEPEFGLYLLRRPPPEFAWRSTWLRWPDFGLPSDREAAGRALREAWERALEERVEIACGGGRGRTGTALAVLAVLDGVPPSGAVDFVRRSYDRRAVETPWQRRYVESFRP